MEIFISPQGQKHCISNEIDVKLNTNLEYAKSMERMGLPILVYFVLAVPTKNWKSWIEAIIERYKNIYHTIHIVLQCRTWNLSNEDKTWLTLMPNNCEIHIFNDHPSSPVQENKLYGGQAHDPYCGEYRGFSMLYEIALKNPDKIVAYGHSKGISHFNNFHECLGPGRETNKCMLLLENTERARDIFSFIPNVNSVGWYSCSSIIENGRTRAHWWNFFFVRASFIIQCGPPEKTTVRHYYEGHYLLGNNTIDNWHYDMRPCSCKLSHNCCHYDVKEPFFPNIGYDYDPSSNSFKKCLSNKLEMKSLTDICKSELAGCSRASESGSDKLDWHAYMPVYEERLEPYRNSAERVLEVGVQGGGSIVMWQKYFTNAKIVGVELSGSEMMTEKSTQLLDANKSNIHWTTDGYKPETVEMLRNMYGSFDIVIDDGPHTIESQIYFASNYSNLVKTGGLLIVEDIAGLENAQKIFEALPDYMDGEIVNLLHVTNRFDDIMVIAKRKA